jgi:hypothetical protein
LHTLRHIVLRAGRLTRPEGKLTLTMSGNREVRDGVLRYLRAATPRRSYATLGYFLPVYAGALTVQGGAPSDDGSRPSTRTAADLSDDDFYAPYCAACG